jgi:DNA-binding MarR family transcriptional regulator
MGESPDSHSAASESETAVFERSLSAVVRWLRATRTRALQQVCHEMLCVLAEHGPMTGTALAELLHVHPSSAKRMVDRLVPMGFVCREQSPVTGRSISVTLTDRGRLIVTEVSKHQRLAIVHVMPVMGVEQRASLMDGLAIFTHLASTRLARSDPTRIS